MIKKESELYVWIKADYHSSEMGLINQTVEIISDPVELYYSDKFDKKLDKIFRLGEEVEVKVSVEIKKKKPVYRGNSSELYEE